MKDNTKKLKGAELYKKVSEEDTSENKSTTKLKGAELYKKVSEYDSIGMDTFSSDLKTTGNTIKNLYGGWQSREALSTAQKDITKMMGRVSAYQNYSSKYGALGRDMSGILSGYNDILDNWDSLTSVYNRYKSEEDYNSANRRAELEKKYKGSSYQQIQDALKNAEKDSDEYNYLKNYTDYTDFKDIEAVIEERKGNKNDPVLKKFEQERNKRINDNAFNKYAYLLEESDFDGSYDPSINDLIYKTVNDSFDSKGIIGKVGNAVENFSFMTDDEKAVFNYLYKQNPKEAIQYSNDMRKTLDKRATGLVSEYATSGDSLVKDIVASALSIPANIAGGIGTAGATMNDFGNPYSSANMLTNVSADIRESVSQDLADLGDGFFYDNVLPFLYGTGMSMGDSILGGTMLGEYYLPFMGFSAYQNRYRELKESGETEFKSQAGAITSGLAELIAEKLPLEKLLNVKGIDSKKAIIKNSLSQLATEGLEEGATEVMNALSDWAVRQDTSDIVTEFDELKAQGYSDSEAWMQVGGGLLGRVVEASLGGALSGGVTGSIYGSVNYKSNKEAGSDLRLHGNIQDMLDISSKGLRQKKWILSTTMMVFQKV